LDPDDYPLEDKQTEKKFTFTLAQAQINAKKNKNKLLHGKIIYCIENIRGGFDVFKSIVEANGGKCQLFRGRNGVKISARLSSEEDIEQGHEDEVYLISGNEKDQSRFWPVFRTMATNSKRVPKIVEPEWILDIAMSQEWRWAESYEWPESMEDVEMK
jgi:hypothetical protein